jgi:hypothetical protein
MVNNSTNINQHNKQPPPHRKPLNTKKTMRYDSGNLGPGVGQAQKCGWVKLGNMIPMVIQIYKQTTQKPAYICFNFNTLSQK